MIVDWIYNHPTGLWGSILVCGTTVLACLGLALFHPFVDVRVRRAHNDLAGFSIAIISVVYAVLLAFIAVATWESFSSAEAIVQAEAGYIGNLYRDTKGFPDQIGERMRNTLKDYTETVIRAEWPMQREGEVPSSGWKSLYKLHHQLVSFEPQTSREGIIEAEFLRVLNELYKAREARLTAAAGHIPVVIWWIIAIGGALTTALHLFVRLRKLSPAPHDDRCGGRLTVACRRADRRARLAVPWRGQRVARRLRGCRAGLEGARRGVTLGFAWGSAGRTHLLDRLQERFGRKRLRQIK